MSTRMLFPEQLCCSAVPVQLQVCAVLIYRCSTQLNACNHATIACDPCPPHVDGCMQYEVFMAYGEDAIQALSVCIAYAQSSVYQ
jgi:hypothetical protein